MIISYPRLSRQSTIQKWSYCQLGWWLPYSNKSRVGRPRPCPIFYVCMLAYHAGFVGQQEAQSLTSPAKRPIFLCSFLINDPSLFETLCRQAYFTATPLSLGQATSMYGILYYLLKEYVLLQSPLAQKHDLKVHTSTCERNLCRGIETYQTLAMPCFENVLSLALGVGIQRHSTFTSQVEC